MFVEASALAAMLLDERQARLLAGRLQGAATRLTAVPCLIDALTAIGAERGLDPAQVSPLLDRFLEALTIRTASLPAALGQPAAAAMARFGRSPTRPDGITANQCLSYAAARYYRLPLLFADPAVALTDIQPG